MSKDIREIGGVIRFMWIGCNQWDVQLYNGVTWEHTTTICSPYKSHAKKLWSVYQYPDEYEELGDDGECVYNY